MRAVIQRVKEASVTVDGSVVSQIGRGLLVLIGISAKDGKKDAAYIVRKILNLRLFPNADGSRRWDKSVKDLEMEVLCISQFTLYAESKANRLDFHRAMEHELAQQLYSDVIQQMRESYLSERVKDGIFGTKREVQLINDGPVTIVLDSYANDSERKSNGDTELGHTYRTTES
ncbi:D-aminoacyl-tRNA deacylase [Fasciolopsis buskii]|uniref:D-aminoacyl-tRNA deacylase n=1 Tax=Fasciolopsis buskii TaxID=27845 RepID=A0A8E0VPK7_9TREM|nr:D-aminoacyl-tRNA deacylase [Fasciolopsis buski]